VELNNATATPQALELDLAELAGREVTLKLTCDPGPQHSATFDWARWREPRLIFNRQMTGVARIVSPQPWKLALTSAGETTPRELAPHQYEISTTFPGAIYLLNLPLQPVALPGDLTTLNFVRSYLSPEGLSLNNPQYATASVADTTVGGVTKHGFFAHPPSQGQTRMDFPLRLPAEVRRFTCQVGLRDGSKSEGCLFIIEVTGQEVARKRMLPGKWEELTADLAPFAGRPVVLSVVTDAETTFSFDWAAWAEPRLE
jgi:hypothetical protein